MLNRSDEPLPLVPESEQEIVAVPLMTRSLAEALELAEALQPDDRMRLIAELWQSLPPKNRAAIIAYGLENLHASDDQKPRVSPAASPDPIWPELRRVLFDPANTSQLYSAPKRFDLATIFVIT